jgi:hypothetical protein
MLRLPLCERRSHFLSLRYELDLVTRLARQEELIQQLLNQQAATNQPSSAPHPVIQQMLDQQEAASSRPPSISASMGGLNAELAAPNNGIPGSDATTNPEAGPYHYNNQAEFLLSPA